MRVNVTWRYKGRKYSDECDLLEDDDQLVTKNGVPIPDDIIDQMAKDGLVMFCDETGVFILEAKRIVSIVPL